jgi:hypothetical protein
MNSHSHFSSLIPVTPSILRDRRNQLVDERLLLDKQRLLFLDFELRVVENRIQAVKLGTKLFLDLTAGDDNRLLRFEKRLLLFDLEERFVENHMRLGDLGATITKFFLNPNVEAVW